MRLASASFVLDLLLYEGEAVSLVVEKPELMAEIVEDLSLQCNGQEGEFVLSETQKQLSFEKNAECIIDPFSLDFNHRKIVNKLYSDLVMAEEDYCQAKTELTARIIQYLDNLIGECPYSFVSMDLDLDTSKLLKLFNVRIEPDYHSLLEKLGEYTKLVSLLLKKKLLILVNIQDYLTADEVEMFLKTVSYLKLYVLFVEGHEHECTIGRETWIIDRDRCIIKK